MKIAFEAHKRLPKFQHLLGNLITSTCVQSDYIGMCVIRLHQHVCNPITQRV